MISTRIESNAQPLPENLQDKFDLNCKENDRKGVFSPGRINLIGEHTDYNLGYVFPAAIDKGILVAIKRTSKNHSSVTAIDKGETYDFSMDTIKPLKNGGWRNYVLGVIDELLKLNFKIPDVKIEDGTYLVDLWEK
jgi:galactokinase